MLGVINIEQVIDIREIPRFRHYLHFAEEELRIELHKFAIDYIRLEGLGGLRHIPVTSINAAWLNASFCSFLITYGFPNLPGQ
jgi:hypothetical protein